MIPVSDMGEPDLKEKVEGAVSSTRAIPAGSPAASATGRLTTLSTLPDGVEIDIAPLSDQLWSELLPVIEAQRARGDMPHVNDPPLNLNMALYHKIEEAGMLRGYTLRKDGRLVGYGCFIKAPSLRFLGLVEVASHSLFVLPEVRGRLGLAFLRFIEQDLMAEGVHLIVQTAHPGSRECRLFDLMGYTLEHHEYHKWIRKEGR